MYTFFCIKLKYSLKVFESGNDEEKCYSFNDCRLDNNVTHSKHLYVKVVGIIFLVVTLLLFLVFVILPIIFMHCLALQTLFMFMNINLPTDQSYYDNFDEKGYRNLYVSVKDFLTNKTIDLGVWHLLPHNLTNDSIIDKNFDYDAALAESNYSVILYFHGMGESRSYCLEMYQVLRNVSHVIAFDYRNFADSSHAILNEDGVVNDSVQIFKWLRTKTKSDIYVWGHSLGSALATHTVSTLKNYSIIPAGLFLESPFTSMREELPVHKFGKLFAWLPWFQTTVLDPLYRNGFRFETDKHIINVDCPIMIMHTEDDSVVPFKLGLKLFHIAQSKRNSSQGKAIFHSFDASHHYDHFRIYEEPRLTEYIENFMNTSVTHFNNEKISV